FGPEDGARPGHCADEIDHRAMAARARRAEGQTQYGPQVVLELAGFRTFDGPVAGVVDARRHLVGDELAGAHEELDGENSGVTEVLECTLEIARGASA